MGSEKRQMIFLWPYVEWGGAQIYCMAIMKLAREAWNIVVILPKGSSQDLLDMLNDLGVEVRFLGSAMDFGPANSFQRKVSRQFARIRTEFHALRAVSRYDLRKSVLHIDFAPWQSWILYTILSIKGANTFVTLHNFISKQPKWRELIFRARLQFLSRLPGFRIFASNKDTRDKLAGWVAPRFGSDVPVTYTCADKVSIESIDGEAVERNAIRGRYGIPAEKFVVLTVGQFIDRKGRWSLLEAARIAAASDREVHFIWVTPALPSDEDAERVRSYGLGERFRLILSSSIGESRLDVLRFFKVADCFVLPSFIEGLPIAILEAMAFGIPTISTRVFAIPEAVRHEETGLLVDAGDSERLCEAILRIKGDRELAKRISEAGRKLVLEEFDERDASRIAIKEFEECFNRR